MATPWRILAATTAGTAAVVALLWLTDVPLGIPGEWAWTRIVAAPDEVSDRRLGLVAATIAAAVLLGVTWLGSQRIDAAGRVGVALRLALLWVAGFAWLWIVQESPPGTRRMQKAPLVAYSPSSSGYFFHDRFRIDDVRAFLRGYEDWTRQGDVLHFGTHPPGLFLFHRGLTRLCERSPGLTRLVLSTRPASAREAFDLIDRVPMGAPRRLTDAERAGLWLAVLAAQAAAALTVVPLYLLMRRAAGRRAAWLGASLWQFVPALAIFLPKSDTLYPLLGTLIVWCGLEAASRRSTVLGIVLGICVGVLLFVGLGFTLAFLPVACVTVLAAAAESFRSTSSLPHRPCAGGEMTDQLPGEATRSNSSLQSLDRSLPPRPILSELAPWLAGLATFAALLLVARAAYDIDLLAVWKQNLANHAGFYEKYPRTKSLWLLVNPLEAAIAVGWPVCCVALMAVWRAIAAKATPAGTAQGADGALRGRIAALTVAAVSAALWLSGRNSGEAARLWLLLFPWALWLASLEFERLLMAAPSEARPARFRAVFLAVAVPQAVCAVATILRVFGFDFGN